MDIHRRSVIKAASTVGAVGFAGCIGGGLSVEETEPFSTAVNNVGLNVLVANGSSSAEEGTLSGTVDMENGGAYSERKNITVSADESEWFELRFDIDWTEQLSGGEFDYEATIE